MNQEILLGIPRQWASPQHRSRLPTTDGSFSYAGEEAGRVRRVLLFAPRNPDSPAGNAKIVIPGTMIRHSGRALFGERK
ncbi:MULTISPECIES: hypothetical protein [unclassified Arthrobacter]|uniref:hypothetical protein n=1 Tax=unclassified Arthrobacter TaxID=235627 RepID=UPI002882F884|nr:MULTISPECIES: hypothetical protein [unclassified Arthrobacter]